METISTASFMTSVAWHYHSHVDEPRDVPRGLFGAIIIAARGMANATGGASDIHTDDEFVIYMSNFFPAGSSRMFYTVNGISFGNLKVFFPFKFGVLSDLTPISNRSTYFILHLAFWRFYVLRVGYWRPPVAALRTSPPNAFRASTASLARSDANFLLLLF